MALLIFEQAINGLQLGMMLFLMAAGLTLVFGIMNFINLAHGSLYMLGAFAAASALRLSGSFLVAVIVGLAAAALIGAIIEALALRKLYSRDHLDQVLGTFGLLLFFNELARIVWGDAPVYAVVPSALSGFVALPGNINYPVYRLVIAAVGFAIAAALFILIARTRLGMLIRAGASNREMLGSLGVNVPLLFALVFVLGAALAGLAGALAGPLLAVEVGMGEPVLIIAFVIVIIGGVGSMWGALVGALLVGIVDTLGRSLLPHAFGYTVGPALSSMSVYLLMALMLWLRPQGLFPVPTSPVESPSGQSADDANRWSPRLRNAAIALAILLLIAVPLLDEPFYVRLVTRIMIFAIAAVSLGFIFGFGGMVSFGHAGFFGIGAYAVGIAAHHGITSAAVVWPLAVAAAALSALCVGAIALRTTGVYFIMITLAFGQMIYFLAVSLEPYGGDNGLPLRAHTDFLGILDLGHALSLYCVTAAVLALALWAGHKIIGSEFGLTLRGIRDNERRLRTIGFQTFRYRLVAFTMAGGLAGLAGALLVNVDSYVGPSSLHWFVSGELMIMVILGGAGSLVGPVIGAATFLMLEETLSGLTEHWMVIFGPLLLLLVLFTRGGLFGWLATRRTAHG